MAPSCGGATLPFPGVRPERGIHMPAQGNALGNRTQTKIRRALKGRDKRPSRVECALEGGIEDDVRPDQGSVLFLFRAF
jgi:hypothetical protein